MKIKIFKAINFRELEDKVNKFIEDKCVINISHEVTLRESCGSVWTILIIVVLYDELDHCGYLDRESLDNFDKYRL